MVVAVDDIWEGRRHPVVRGQKVDKRERNDEEKVVGGGVGVVAEDNTV